MSCTLCTIFAVVVQNVAFTNHSQFILAIFLLQEGMALAHIEHQDHQPEHQDHLRT